MQDMMTVSGDFMKQSIESASSSSSSNRDKSGGQNPQRLLRTGARRFIARSPAVAEREREPRAIDRQ